MFARTNALNPGAPFEVTVEHGGYKATFSIAVFGKRYFQEGYDVFAEINAYWASLPLSEQAEIFDIYSGAQSDFDNCLGRAALTESLKHRVNDLVNKHNLDKLQDWVSIKSAIRIPDDIAVQYTDNIDNNNSRSKTYIRRDYIQLVTMSLFLRTMLPIFGEYIFHTRSSVGTQFKEQAAFQLLAETTVNTSKPMLRLKEYIEAIVDKDKHDSGKLLQGISSEDFSHWMLSLICVRRLCTCDIRGVVPKSGLCPLIYKFIMNTRNPDNNFENQVKDKGRPEDKGSNSNDGISMLERYKIKTNISLEDVVAISFSIHDIHGIADKLTSRIDHMQLARSLETCQQLQTERMLEPQMTLLRWVLKPVASPKGLMYLPKMTCVNLLGLLEEVLWATGHKYLALLATSYAMNSANDMLVSPVDSKMRVSKELQDELSKYYPYTRLANSKRADGKEVNLAAKSIDLLTDSLAMYSWRSTADESRLKEVFGSTSRRFPILPDIKTHLTKLVIEIGSRATV